MDTRNWWKTASVAFLLAMAMAPVQAQSFKVLYRFTGGADGGVPMAALLLRNGKLYGTNTYGGSAISPSGYGTIFALDLTTRQETTLHAFSGADGAYPKASLISDAQDNLYGTTSGGGPNSNQGVVFELTPAGGFTVLYGLAGRTGFDPDSLVSDAEGNIYGAAGGGGTYEGGMVFKIDSAGNFSTVHEFRPGKRGAGPSGLLLEGDTLYGEALGGGGNHAGAIFQIGTAKGRESVIYAFGITDGNQPQGGLISDGAGNLYGTTLFGSSPGVVSSRESPRGYGVVFVLNIATRQETVLHSFTGRPDGRYPQGGLVRDSAGNLYGTTSRGGSHNQGTVFKVDTSGTCTILHSFTGKGDGGVPGAGLAIGLAGHLYGTTESGGGSAGAGTVFEVVP